MHFIICQLHPNNAVKKLTEKSPLLHLNHLPKDFSVKKKGRKKKKDLSFQIQRAYKPLGKSNEFYSGEIS